MEAIDVAWSILKAAFQPSAATHRLGAGNTQVVFGQTGNPDVMKVGDLQRSPQQLSHMYYNELLSRIPKLRLFTGQQLTEQTEELPSDLQYMSLPYLSRQPRIDPLSSSGNKMTDNLRGLLSKHSCMRLFLCWKRWAFTTSSHPTSGQCPATWGVH